MNAKLCDVGLARAVGELQDAGRTHMSTRHLLGSPGYIDPLFVETLQYAQRTDNYALGITLLVAFTGRQPSDARAGAIRSTA